MGSLENDRSGGSRMNNLICGLWLIIGLFGQKQILLFLLNLLTETAESGSDRFSVLQNSVRAEFCQVQISESASRLAAPPELLQFLLVRL